MGQKGALLPKVKRPETPLRQGCSWISMVQKKSVKNLRSFIKKLFFGDVFSVAKTMARPLLLPVPVANSSIDYKEKVAVLTHTTE